jgi:hypothetical protein
VVPWVTADTRARGLRPSGCRSTMAPPGTSPGGVKSKRTEVKPAPTFPAASSTLSATSWTPSGSSAPTCPRHVTSRGASVEASHVNPRAPSVALTTEPASSGPKVHRTLTASKPACLLEGGMLSAGGHVTTGTRVSMVNAPTLVGESWLPARSVTPRTQRRYTPSSSGCTTWKKVTQGTVETPGSKRMVAPCRRASSTAPSATASVNCNWTSTARPTAATGGSTDTWATAGGVKSTTTPPTWSHGLAFPTTSTAWSHRR